MTTITFKINERTKAGKAFMTMKDTFFANANGIEIVEKTKKTLDSIQNEFYDLQNEIEKLPKSDPKRNKLISKQAILLNSSVKSNTISTNEIVEECNIVRKLRYENAK